LKLTSADSAFHKILATQSRNLTQKANGNVLLHWAWILTPLKEGDHILSLSISGPNGEISLPPRTIHVDVRARKKEDLQNFLAYLRLNWQIITSIFGFCGFLITFFGIRIASDSKQNSKGKPSKNRNVKK
jgi:hypothetical protein